VTESPLSGIVELDSNDIWSTLRNFISSSLSKKNEHPNKTAKKDKINGFMSNLFL
jgi:hypothetical protein